MQEEKITNESKKMKNILEEKYGDNLTNVR